MAQPATNSILHPLPPSNHSNTEQSVNDVDKDSDEPAYVHFGNALFFAKCGSVFEILRLKKQKLNDGDSVATSISNPNSRDSLTSSTIETNSNSKKRKQPMDVESDNDEQTNQRAISNHTIENILKTDKALSKLVKFKSAFANIIRIFCHLMTGNICRSD